MLKRSLLLCAFLFSSYIFAQDAKQTVELKPVYTACFSRDGSKIAAAGVGGKVNIWNAENGNKLMTLDTGSAYYIKSISFNSDGTLLAAGSPYSGITIWNTNDGKIIKQINEVSSSVTFSPDGRHFFSGIWAPRCSMWETTTWEKVTDFMTLKKNIGHNPCSIAINQEGNSIVTGDWQLIIWDTKTPENKHIFIDFTRYIDAVAINKQSSLVAAGTSTGNVTVWDISSGECIKTISESNSGIQCMAFGADNLFAYSASNGDIVIFNSIEDEERVILNAHEKPVYSLSFNNDGNLLLSASGDGTTKLWDMTKRLCIRQFPQSF